MGKTVTNNGVFNGPCLDGCFWHLVAGHKSYLLKTGDVDTLTWFTYSSVAELKAPSNRFLLPLELAL